jgi:D-hydroxyproline dehydrogenase subunit gamma
MAERFSVTIDGRVVEVEAGTTVAVALLAAGAWRFRTSVGGEPRGPICAMGICFECRVTIDGVAQRRACMEPCRPGMGIVTGG